MHDCGKTQEKMIDLVFDEIGADKNNLLAEIDACRICANHYQSVSQTLNMFDMAAEAAQPDESYWLAYDMKLRAKLIEPTRPSLFARLWESFTSFKITPWLPVPVAAAIVLAVIALGIFWGLRGRNIVQPNNHDLGAGQVSPKVDTPPNENKTVVQPTPQNHNLLVSAPKPKPQATKRRNEPAAPKPSSFSDPRAGVVVVAVPPYSGPLNDLIDSNLVRHLEKAQVLLRSFRNTRAGGQEGAFDLAYEKEQAQRLLNQNVVLRRTAEAKGNLPTEELLGGLEPFLIDIANLPDKPVQEDIHSIKERMQKREIVASLQIYSARTAPPSY